VIIIGGVAAASVAGYFVWSFLSDMRGLPGPPPAPPAA
jgi:hypothetical protein